MATQVQIDGKKLIISVDMQEPTPSASGKTMVVASSHGNHKSGVQIDGKDLVLGFNAYIKR